MSPEEILKALKQISQAIDDQKTRFEPIGNLSQEKFLEWQWFSKEADRILREFKLLNAKKDLWWAELRMALPEADAERDTLRIEGSTIMGSVDEEGQ
jgi:hypothetical protein